MASTGLLLSKTHIWVAPLSQPNQVTGPVNSCFEFSFTSRLVSKSPLLFTHNWEEKQWIYAFLIGISIKWNANSFIKDFLLGSPSPFYMIIAVIPKCLLTKYFWEVNIPAKHSVTKSLFWKGNCLHKNSFIFFLCPNIFFLNGDHHSVCHYKVIMNKTPGHEKWISISQCRLYMKPCQRE